MAAEFAKKGDKVKVEYDGMLDNGEIFDSSQHGDHNHPIVFTVGNGEVIKGFDDAVIGMKIGEKRKFSIEPENAYGPHRDELEREFPREDIPVEGDVKVGTIIELATQDGRHFAAKVSKITPEKITLDLNHPLAGKRLTFKIELVEIEDKGE